LCGRRTTKGRTPKEPKAERGGGFFHRAETSGTGGKGSKTGQELGEYPGRVNTGSRKRVLQGAIRRKHHRGRKSAQSRDSETKGIRK